MLTKNIIKTSGIGAAIIAGSMLAVTAASAHMGSFNEEDHQEHISELSERFNLDESEVQAYFDEKREEHEAEREEERAEHIASLVENGTLTQEQSDELKNLHDGFREEIDSLKESEADREEVRTLMDEKRAEIEAWAEAEGIDLEDIRPEMGRKGEKHGFRQ